MPEMLRQILEYALELIVREVLRRISEEANSQLKDSKIN